MGEQGRRMFLAIALAFGIMMIWNVLFPPQKKKAQDEAKKQQATQKAIAAQVIRQSPTIPLGEEKTVSFESEEVKAVFSTYNGSLASWTLKRTQFDNRAEGKSLELVSMGQDPDRRQFIDSFVTGETGLEPSTIALQQAGHTEWDILSQDGHQVTFSLKPQFAAGLSIEKTYRFPKEGFGLEIDYRLKNNTSETIKQFIVFDMFADNDAQGEKAAKWMPKREWEAACDIDGKMKVRGAKYMLKKGPGEESGLVRWAGINHAYFLVALGRLDGGGPVYCQADAVADSNGGVRARLISPLITLKPQDEVRRGFVAYLGPKFMDSLERVEAKGEDQDPPVALGFSESVDMGDYLGPVGRTLLWILVKFHGVVGNWGFAIILLTVFIKLLLLPLTTYSMRSMRKMAKLKPQIEEIQKKYKDDRAKQQQETMALYKSHGASPFIGCLPMFLQMPIWFALYRMIRTAAELYQAEFAWMSDLTLTDPLYILPVILVVAMFFQTRLTPTTGDHMQQKILMYGMPLMFGAISFVLPAGLVLYMLVNTILTALHSFYMYRTEDRGESTKASVKSDEKPAKAGARPSGRKK